MVTLGAPSTEDRERHPQKPYVLTLYIFGALREEVLEAGEPLLREVGRLPRDHPHSQGFRLVLPGGGQPPGFQLRGSRLSRRVRPIPWPPKWVLVPRALLTKVRMLCSGRSVRESTVADKIGRIKGGVESVRLIRTFPLLRISEGESPWYDP